MNHRLFVLPRRFRKPTKFKFTLMKEWDIPSNHFSSPSSSSSTTETRSQKSAPLPKLASRFFGEDRTNPSHIRSPTTCSESEREKKNIFAGLLRECASEYPTLYVSVHRNIQHYWKNVQSLVICMKKAAQRSNEFFRLRYSI